MTTARISDLCSGVWTWDIRVHKTISLTNQLRFWFCMRE